MLGGHPRDHRTLARLRRALAPRFDEPALEEAFRRDQARETAPIVRSGFVVGIPLWIAVAVVLPLAATIDPFVLYATVAVMVVVDAVSLVLVRGVPSMARIDAVGIVSAIANAVAILALAAAASGGQEYALPALMLTTLYAVAIFRIGVPRALAPAAAILAVFLLAVAPTSTPGQLVFDLLSWAP